MKRLSFTFLLFFLISCVLPFHSEAQSPSPSWSVYFSPKGGCTQAIINELDKAKSSIIVQAYGVICSKNGRMWGKTRNILLALILCFLISSIANAQCAWVLWEKTEHTDFSTVGTNINWSVVNAAPDHKGCLELREKKFKETQNAFNYLVKIGNDPAYPMKLS